MPICRTVRIMKNNVKTFFTQEEKQSFHELSRQAHLQSQFGLMGTLEDNGYGVSFMVAYSEEKRDGARYRYNHVQITIFGDKFIVEKHNGYKQTECTSFGKAIEQTRQYLKER